MHPRRRSGSVVAVVWIAVILGILGLASFMLSSSYGRRGFHEGMRHDAYQAARAAAEEAALRINNGAVNAAIDQALDTAAPVPVESPMMGDHLRIMGVPVGAEPKVSVRAAVVKELPGKPPLEELLEIEQEIAKGGYGPEVTKFWERMREEGVTDDGKTSSFYNMAASAKIKDWGPKGRSAQVDNSVSPPVVTQKAVPDKSISELRAIFDLFYEHDGSEAIDENGASVGLAASGIGGTKGAPGAGALLPAWNAGMKEVAKESARWLSSCGANPNLAVAHLVGDLALGEVIASGTEVNVTSNFMKSKELDDNQVYLLEIEAAAPYGGAGATRMQGEMKHTTYRLFTKVAWEQAIGWLTESLVGDLVDLGVPASQIAQMWPAHPTEEGRQAPVPGSPGTKYDPKKPIWDVIAEDMPPTAGARMYPYVLARTQGKP